MECDKLAVFLKKQLHTFFPLEKFPSDDFFVQNTDKAISCTEPCITSSKYWGGGGKPLEFCSVLYFPLLVFSCLL